MSTGRFLGFRAAAAGLLAIMATSGWTGPAVADEAGPLSPRPP